MSRTFSTNCGSLENLKFSTRCGCRPNACQIRTMAFCDRPVSAAIRRVLQCVLLAGIDSKVLVTTSSTCESVIWRGAPTRGSSSKPSNPDLRNRSRHFPTVAPVMCNLRATSELLIPAPQPSTMRARIAMACDDFGRRAIMFNFSRSSAAISSGFLGRPVRIPQYAGLQLLLQRISRSGH